MRKRDASALKYFGIEGPHQGGSFDISRENKSHRLRSYTTTCHLTQRVAQIGQDLGRAESDSRGRCHM